MLILFLVVHNQVAEMYNNEKKNLPLDVDVLLAYIKYIFSF